MKRNKERFSEYLDKMVTLERAINDLAAFLEDESNEFISDDSFSTEEWLTLHSVAELAKSMTSTKLAISYIHDRFEDKMYELK